ncbi:cytochrome c [Epibacterium sp. SM1979]|uniref:Cytochrome c n=1 Tax=Tritonibacter litoralis TaxID=2662264 RepID=A0A843YCJ7_9RHOB|nr:cytochrome c [Tritonibacter litoralis]MQQ07204.1 cytochrome c [Tritonibacter litoralis]
MSYITKIASVAISAIVISTPVFAQDAKVLEAAVKARQAQMTLYAFNLGLLGDMAKGKVEYDAQKAQAAASGLTALTKLDGSRMWLPGTDNESLENTRALPAIWAEGSDVGEKSKALKAAVAAMDEAAGQGLEPLKAAIGGLGGACGACHKAYRAPKS